MIPEPVLRLVLQQFPRLMRASKITNGLFSGRLITEMSVFDMNYVFEV